MLFIQRRDDKLFIDQNNKFSVEYDSVRDKIWQKPALNSKLS